VSFFQRLFWGYRRYATPASDMSLSTAVALFTAGGIASLIDAFVSPWPDGPGLFWIGSFYLASAVHSLLRKRTSLPLGDVKWTNRPAFARFYFRCHIIRRPRRADV
jgi:hypothetical protein